MFYSPISMPRSGRLRTFICEYRESPRLEKASFIPPFLILAIEVILIIHAIAVEEFYIIILTMILLIRTTIKTSSSTVLTNTIICLRNWINPSVCFSSICTPLNTMRQIHKNNSELGNISLPKTCIKNCASFSRSPRIKVLCIDQLFSGTKE